MRNDKKVFRHLGGWSYIKGIIDGDGALTDDQKVIWIYHLMVDTPKDPMFSPLTTDPDEELLEKAKFIVHVMNQNLTYVRDSMPTSENLDKLKNDYQTLSHCIQWMNGYLSQHKIAQSTI